MLHSPKAPDRRIKLFCLTLALLFAGGCASIPKTWNVRDTGALGDGHADDTAAIQKALDKCAKRGGGEVDIAPGNYLIGSIVLASNTTLRLESGATLIGSPNIQEYPVVNVRFEGRWVKGHRALIDCENADHVRILGPGKIAGCIPLGDLRNPRAPVLIEFVGCHDVLLDGFSTSYARMWSIHPLYCGNFEARDLQIRSQRGNGDGIDVDSCNTVLIDECDILSGDDSVAIKSGRGEEGVKIARPCENVLITHCKLGSLLFATLGIGSEMSGGVRNIRIEHCVFTQGHDGIYLKSRPGRGGFFDNISAEDIQSDATTFLRIDLLYHGIQDNQPVPGDAGIPLSSNISVNNATVKCTTLVDAQHIPSTHPLKGLTLSNITAVCKKGIYLADIRSAALTNIQATGYTPPLLYIHDVTGTGLQGCVEFTPTTEPTTRQARPMTEPSTRPTMPTTAATNN
jgi:polygalacturonase